MGNFAQIWLIEDPLFTGLRKFVSTYIVSIRLGRFDQLLESMINFVRSLDRCPAKVPVERSLWRK